MTKKKNNTTSNNSVKHAFEARLKRKIAANPKLYLKPLKLRKPSAEERYQMMKQNWFFHPSSWYMRHDKGYDGQGCHNGVCVSECRYYPLQGRLEEDEV